MALIEGINGREPGYDHRNALASIQIEPVVYECDAELTLAIELANRTRAELGVDFKLLELNSESGRRTEPTRHGIASVGKAGPDSATFMRGGMVIPKTALLEATRARFALGTNVLRIPARSRVVVHTEPFARAPLDAAAAKAKQAIGMYLSLCVVVVNAGGAKILADNPLVSLPKSWVVRPRPKDAFVLSPALLLDGPGPEREAAVARSVGFNPDELDSQPVEAAVELIPARDWRCQLPAQPSMFETEGISGLELTGFAHDDDSLQPIHVGALDELTRLLSRIPFELEGLVLEIEGHADGGRTRASEVRAESLALRRVESVRARLASLPAGVEVRTRHVTDGPERSVSLRFIEAREPRSTRWFKVTPMLGHPWPGVTNSYSLTAEFPILARAWNLDPLTLPRLRAIYKKLPSLAAALVPERVRGKPRSNRIEITRLKELGEELERTKSRADTPVPSPHGMEPFVEPFGLHLTRLVGLLALVRDYTLAPEEILQWSGEWGIRVLTVLVDEWQPESQRGWAARLDRLRAISNETELVPALVIAIAEQCATIDTLIDGKQRLARGMDRPNAWIEHARKLGLDQLVDEEALAAWLTKQQQFRAAVDRPDLPDLLGAYDDLLDKFTNLVRAELR